MAGRQQYDRQTIISAMTSKKLKTVSMWDNDALNVGENIDYNIFAEPGNVAKLVSLRYRWDQPSNSTIGNKTMSFIIENSLMYVDFPHNTKIDFINNDLAYSSSANIIAPKEDLMPQVIGNMKFDDKEPFTIRFSNNTDVIIDTFKLVTVAFEQEKVS